MGFLKHLSAYAGPARVRGLRGDPFDDRYYIPSLWSSTLSAAGVAVTPDLALTLSAMYAGMAMISRDLATLPAQTFKERDDGGKDRVKPRYGAGLDDVGGIGSLAYKLRWQPNTFQTATEFWMGMIAQWLMRGLAYAEIVSGPGGFLEQLLPRHPDRITPERLANGRIRFKLSGEANGPRYVTQDEMFVVRDLSLDGGLNSLSRVQYGAEAIGSALATQRAAAKFFKSGMTAAVVATYPGDMEDDEEAALHKSITRYATGVENSFGLMLVPDDVKLSNLSVEPEKAQMMLAQEWGVREVARLLNLPGSKLGIAGSVAYASQVQDALNYVLTCLRPIAVTFEQTVKRDLIIQKDLYSMEFLLAALMRGDFESQANYLDKFIRNRTMRPSEARLLLNMNPDPSLDKLSEGDFRPGATTPPSQGQQQALTSRGLLKATLAVHDNAIRVMRRERAAVAKLAKKYASDVEGWRAGLRDFYGEHAGFVAQTMRVPAAVARAYAAGHGSTFETNGAAVLLDDEAYGGWERFEADELAALALEEPA
jgi:HK97 family phage portal protein